MLSGQTCKGRHLDGSDVSAQALPLHEVPLPFLRKRAAGRQNSCVAVAWQLRLLRHGCYCVVKRGAGAADGTDLPQPAAQHRGAAQLAKLA